MRPLRIILIALGVIALLGLIGGGAAFYFTAGAVTAADNFFQVLAAQGPEAAYVQTAPAFRAAATPADFAAVSDRLGLRGNHGASWSSRSVSGATAELEGTMSLGDHGTLPMTVKLAKDDAGTWRVLSLDTGAGLRTENGTAAAPAPLPDSAAIQQIAQVSLTQLVEAIHAKDFRGLQAATATIFRNQFSADQLAQQFKSFTDKNLDLTGANMQAISFSTPPRLGEHGELILAGTLPAGTQTWYFGFQYRHEPAGWLLTSMSLSSTPP